jgi:hypothetical protein
MHANMQTIRATMHACPLKAAIHADIPSQACRHAERPGCRRTKLLQQQHKLAFQISNVADVPSSSAFRHASHAYTVDFPRWWACSHAEYMPTFQQPDMLTFQSSRACSLAECSQVRRLQTFKSAKHADISELDMLTFQSS